MLKEVVAVWPFEKGGIGKQKKWQNIADELSKGIGFVVDGRRCQNSTLRMLEEFRNQQRRDAAASGVAQDYSERDHLLQGIDERLEIVEAERRRSEQMQQQDREHAHQVLSAATRNYMPSNIGASEPNAMSLASDEDAISPTSESNIMSLTPESGIISPMPRRKRRRRVGTASTSASSFAAASDQLSNLRTQRMEFIRDILTAREDSRLEVDRERLSVDRERLEVEKKRAEREDKILDMKAKRMAIENRRMELENERMELEIRRMRADE